MAVLGAVYTPVVWAFAQDQHIKCMQMEVTYCVLVSELSFEIKVHTH